MMAPLRRFTLSVVSATLVSIAPAHAADGPYVFKKDIAIGGEGGWDYLSVDAAARRLYVTHASKVVVIDLDTEAVVGEVKGTPGVHGFAVAPDLGRGFCTTSIWLLRRSSPRRLPPRARPARGRRWFQAASMSPCFR
ncbi:MAG: hypothetical protein ABI565_13160 [Vicinamibacteria bacterium]